MLDATSPQGPGEQFQRRDPDPAPDERDRTILRYLKTPAEWTRDEQRRAFIGEERGASAPDHDEQAGDITLFVVVGEERAGEKGVEAASGGADHYELAGLWRFSGPVVLDADVVSVPFALDDFNSVELHGWAA